jgi:hypothetical protein
VIFNHFKYLIPMGINILKRPESSQLASATKPPKLSSADAASDSEFSDLGFGTFSETVPVPKVHLTPQPNSEKRHQ